MNLAPVNIWIESVTGERWLERVRLFDTIGELKKRVWRRKRIVPNRQAIVFAGKSLPDELEMSTVGVRDASTLKLIVVARAGPSTGEERDEQLMLSDEVSDREYKRRGHSAAEDTSAKESSAGETEKELDIDDESKLIRVTGAFGPCSLRHQRRNRTNSQGNTKEFLGVYEECVPLLSVEESEQTIQSNSLGTFTLTLEKFENLRLQSPIGEELLSDDPSELSSGMIICDLSNDFRRQKSFWTFVKVRRHRHPPALSACRQRARSKPGTIRREGSSSDDNENSQTEPILFALPIRRGLPTRSVRTVPFRGGVARCSVCAFRINSAFNCRCGKTLCSRHRAAQSHTCSKIRAKLQQVSD
ncbi:AN1-like Zinc finger [Dictyocaulus viviparus]|uniref:AN1-like Zinc finger n=1 Tax=Dictyocaulus viviparus TaxID=29172 RepID=A0A0D8XI71_DICVI|nr:AN1-like Zinc finger [Dictyocaulus viviparus]